ncbi:MAG: hypothetical protein QN152_09275 [Armatimonadota bacterium]|nr:hypothetical protein [Armatimonadota bacterium]MDR7468912.1 hypothetical protein [Armatimonadota bacterium]MDR7474847.1 hypothetical protein [Armatimonadota bacterium]MDR7539702.1 hypothetical protein [Armatimonadota bacterium]
MGWRRRTSACATLCAPSHAGRVRILERGSNPIETPAAMRVLAVLSREAGAVRRALHLL